MGKSNQTSKVAPIHPIPAVGELFENLAVDCVGPLPTSRSGVMYLLTAETRGIQQHIQCVILKLSQWY